MTPQVLLAKRLFDVFLGRAKLPYKLNWVITKSCQSRCVHCQIWKVKPENELTLTEIEIFNQKNRYFSWVNFTGGEPTDRIDFPEIVSLFVQYQKGLLLTHFPTNGLKPDHIINQVKQILTSGLKELHVTVSVDGTEKINDRLRGIQGDFRSAMETIKKLKEISQVKTFVGMTLYPYNVHHVEETYKAIQNEIPGFEYSRFHVNIPHISSHFYENQGIRVKAQEALIKAVEEYKKKREKKLSAIFLMEDTYQTLALSYLKTGQTPMDCSALLASCFMNEKGVIYPCSIWDKPLGSLRDYDYDLKQLFSQEKIPLIRQNIIEKSCANCWTPCEAFQSILGKPFQAIRRKNR